MNLESVIISIKGLVGAHNSGLTTSELEDLYKEIEFKILPYAHFNCKNTEDFIEKYMPGMLKTSRDSVGNKVYHLIETDDVKHITKLIKNTKSKNKKNKIKPHQKAIPAKSYSSLKKNKVSYPLLKTHQSYHTFSFRIPTTSFNKTNITSFKPNLNTKPSFHMKMPPKKMETFAFNCNNGGGDAPYQKYKESKFNSFGSSGYYKKENDDEEYEYEDDDIIYNAQKSLEKKPFKDMSSKNNNTKQSHKEASIKNNNFDHFYKKNDNNFNKKFPVKSIENNFIKISENSSLTAFGKNQTSFKISTNTTITTATKSTTTTNLVSKTTEKTLDTNKKVDISGLFADSSLLTDPLIFDFVDEDLNEDYRFKVINLNNIHDKKNNIISNSKPNVEIRSKNSKSLNEKRRITSEDKFEPISNESYFFQKTTKYNGKIKEVDSSIIPITTSFLSSRSSKQLASSSLAPLAPDIPSLHNNLRFQVDMNSNDVSLSFNSSKDSEKSQENIEIFKELGTRSFPLNQLKSSPSCSPNIQTDNLFRKKEETLQKQSSIKSNYSSTTQYLHKPHYLQLNQQPECNLQENDNFTKKNSNQEIENRNISFKKSIQNNFQTVFSTCKSIPLSPINSVFNQRTNFIKSQQLVKIPTTNNFHPQPPNTTNDQISSLMNQLSQLNQNDLFLIFNKFQQLTTQNKFSQQQQQPNQHLNESLLSSNNNSFFPNLKTHQIPNTQQSFISTQGNSQQQQQFQKQQLQVDKMQQYYLIQQQIQEHTKHQLQEEAKQQHEQLIQKYKQNYYQQQIQQVNSSQQILPNFQQQYFLQSQIPQQLLQQSSFQLSQQNQPQLTQTSQLEFQQKKLFLNLIQNKSHEQQQQLIQHFQNLSRHDQILFLSSLHNSFPFPSSVCSNEISESTNTTISSNFVLSGQRQNTCQQTTSCSLLTKSSGPLQYSRNQIINQNGSLNEKISKIPLQNSSPLSTSCASLTSTFPSSPSSFLSSSSFSSPSFSVSSLSSSSTQSSQTFSPEPSSSTPLKDSWAVEDAISIKMGKVVEVDSDNQISCLTYNDNQLIKMKLSSLDEVELDGDFLKYLLLNNNFLFLIEQRKNELFGTIWKTNEKQKLNLNALIMEHSLWPLHISQGKTRYSLYELFALRNLWSQKKHLSQTQVAPIDILTEEIQNEIKQERSVSSKHEKIALCVYDSITDEGCINLLMRLEDLHRIGMMRKDISISLCSVEKVPYCPLITRMENFFLDNSSPQVFMLNMVSVACYLTKFDAKYFVWPQEAIQLVRSTFKKGDRVIINDVKVIEKIISPTLFCGNPRVSPVISGRIKSDLRSISMVPSLSYLISQSIGSKFTPKKLERPSFGDYVFITYVDNSYQFYAISLKDMGEFRHLLKEMQTFYNNSDQDSIISFSLSNLTDQSENSNAFYAYKDPKDQAWYRIRIDLCNRSENQIEIFYVDVGKKLSIKFDLDSIKSLSSVDPNLKIFYLPDQFHFIPAFTFSFHLAFSHENLADKIIHKKMRLFEIEGRGVTLLDPSNAEHPFIH